MANPTTPPPPDEVTGQDQKQPEPATQTSPSRAKKIYGWTCNLVATGLVLIAGLMFGTQVLQWWNTDEGPLQTPRPSWEVLGDRGIPSADVPLELEIADWPTTLTRAEFTGDEKAAQQELRRLCLAVAEQAIFPTQPAGPAEQKMIASLKHQKPISQLPGGWELYEQAGPMPLVAVVGERPAAGSTQPSGPLKTGITGSAEVASPARRVVSWGIGVHFTGTKWTLLLLTARAKSAEPDSAWPRLPIPPHARRVLSLAAAERESVISFVGNGPLESWLSFYDQHFSEMATEGASTWQQSGEVWQQRYFTPTALIEIQLVTSDHSDQIQGLLTARAILGGQKKLNNR